MQVKSIKVEINPINTARLDDADLHEVQIIVDTHNMPPTCIRESIPDHDFISRFDYMMKRLSRIVMDVVNDK